ncbi:hypothetical protein AVEN_213294-1 [Araneus ventricosus]|uniref:Gustatory receptor n=1 Tax=Araneus ventricosus TaxID=182803 RepID=A0A4Y2IP95_ARAVE|nr:hypothetical protein AVEN_213294-1 [Araneus ventricosus]
MYLNPLVVSCIIVSLVGFYCCVCTCLKFYCNEFVIKAKNCNGLLDYERILKYYEELSSIFILMDDSFSYPVFIAVLNCMIEIFWACYIFVYFEPNDCLGTSFIVERFVINVVFLIMVILPASAANEAAVDARNFILISPGLLPQRCKEINLFILRISIRQPTLTLWRFYKIKKGLLISAGGTLLTYGILLGTLGNMSV